MSSRTWSAKTAGRRRPDDFQARLQTETRRYCLEAQGPRVSLRPEQKLGSRRRIQRRRPRCASSRRAPGERDGSAAMIQSAEKRGKIIRHLEAAMELADQLQDGGNDVSHRTSARCGALTVILAGQRRLLGDCQRNGHYFILGRRESRFLAVENRASCAK
jgi:hypothetical protein